MLVMCILNDAHVMDTPNQWLTEFKDYVFIIKILAERHKKFQT